MSTVAAEARGVLRHRWDALLVALALGQGVLLAVVPVAPVVALGLWWNSNTVAHYALHRPLFHSRRLNLLFGLYLTVLLGVPQTLWRERHLAHHADRPWVFRWSAALAVEFAAVLGLWTLLLLLTPEFFLTAYAPGYAVGLGLCWLHGRLEHPAGAAVSHRGRLYNWLFLNDGYHIEHHDQPSRHWTELPGHGAAGPTSRWPAVLRWLDTPLLERLERGAMRSPRLRRFLVDRHERAFRQVLPTDVPIHRVAIVGGGLFPRTALVLRRLLPEARLVVIDCNRANLDAARELLPADVEVIHAFYDPRTMTDFDLVVVPLCYVGDRETLYREPPAPWLAVHDWLWRRRGVGAVVSWLLLKRLNLVRR